MFGPPPCTPPPAFIFNRLPFLPTPTPVFKMHRLFGFILSLLISIETCAYVLLSWYALRGEALRPPPCTPPTRFYFLTGYLSTYSCAFFFHMHRFIWVHLILIDMYRNLCLCTSFLERIAGGGAAPLFSPPPSTPPPAFIFNRLPVLPTPTPFFSYMHRLFGFILSLLISIETCAYVLLSWYALRGEPPCTPHPLMFF